MDDVCTSSVHGVLEPSVIRRPKGEIVGSFLLDASCLGVEQWYIDGAGRESVGHYGHGHAAVGRGEGH